MSMKVLESQFEHIEAKIKMAGYCVRQPWCVKLFTNPLCHMSTILGSKLNG